MNAAMFRRFYDYLFSNNNTVAYANLENVQIDVPDEVSDEANLTITLNVVEFENIKKAHYHKGVRKGIIVSGIVFASILVIVVSVFAIVYK